ncbi:MAG: hypothetical protein EBR86_08865 [Planctomycetia bacterium]|nr:hypothetical protein [Planctomycetia bacterium]
MSTDTPIVLHVGGPKTGSSALQYDFTWNPVRPALDRPGVAYEYVALNARGQLRRGRGLAEMASRFAAHYANSAAIESLFRLPQRRLAACIGELQAMRRDGIVPVLSYELWLHSERSLVERFAALFDAPLEVVAYVRDPVSWLTSAYWQRHQVEGASLNQWIEAYLPLTYWADHLDGWVALPNTRVAVRVMEGSVPADFCRLLGCAASPGDVRHNTSLPGPFARFLTRHHLPATVSVSEMKFAWWRWVGSLDRGAERARALGGLPRVIEQPQLETIIAATRAANERLLAQCDAETAARIRADPRWWSADAADHDVDHHLGEQAPGVEREPPHAPATDGLLELSLEATMAADTAWRKASYELEELRAADTERTLRCHELQRQASLAEHGRQEAEHRCREVEHTCEHLQWELRLARQRIEKLERRGCLPHPWRKAA